MLLTQAWTIAVLCKSAESKDFPKKPEYLWRPAGGTRHGVNDLLQTELALQKSERAEQVLAIARAKRAARQARKVKKHKKKRSSE